MKSVLKLGMVFGFCCLNLMAPMQMFSQQVELQEIYATSPIEVKNPLLVDSIDRDGHSFGDEKLLKLGLEIPEQKDFKQSYKVDTSGFFRIESADKKKAVQLFSFYVHGNGYGKAKVKIVSPNMIELFVDGKSVATKTTTESSLAGAREISAALNPYPQTNRVVAKILSNSDRDKQISFSVVVENDSVASKRKLTIFGQPAESKRSIVLDDVIKGKRVNNVTVSPQGNYVLISYADNQGKNSLYSTELYTPKNGRRIVIDTDRRMRQLSWMPNSERLYYLSTVGDVTNLMMIEPQTMEESVMAKNIPNERIVFSPKEDAFFYTQSDDSKSSIDDVFLMHTLADRTGGELPHPFIYRYDLNTHAQQQLTFGDHGTFLNDISRDGNYLLFTISDETITERPFRKSSLFRLNLQTMQVDTLWWKEKFASSAQFSPDGKRVLILGGPDAFDGTGLNVAPGQIANSYDTQAFLMDLSTRKIDPITKDFDPSITQAQWNPKDGLIYFQVEEGDHVNLYTYSTTTRKFIKLPMEEEVLDGFDLSDNGTIMAYSGVSVSNSTRAYLYDLKTKKNTLISDPYGAHLAELKLGKVENWNFTNTAGTEIKGFYYLPPDFDATRKYPMIVYYYGGTSPSERRFESRYPMHVYAALGYVIYVVQPSGATGFGQKFSALHVNTWGERSSDDIIEGTKKFIEEHPFVDGSKVGCIGASYGGFMTMYLQTRTDLFAAAVSHAGISSISSYWGEGYWGYAYGTAASANSYPWNNRDLYVNQSPLFNADKIKTPILLVHGTADTNVPTGESIQMYTALKILGKPVELVQVKGENHHILDYEKRLKWNESIFAWFEKWLKGDTSWWNDLYKVKGEK